MIRIKPQTDLSKFITHKTTMTVYTETGINKSFKSYLKREAAKSSKNRSRSLHKTGRDGSKQGCG